MAAAEAAQRFAVGDYAAATAWERPRRRLADAREALAEGAGRRRQARASRRSRRAKPAPRARRSGLRSRSSANHPPAAAGLARAGRIDEALALVDAAQRDEQAGRAPAAEPGYRKALVDR